MTDEELEVIKARAEAASPGPWEVQGIFVYVSRDKPNVEDAEFAAHARADVPAPVAEVERLHKEIVEVRKALQETFVAAALKDAEVTPSEDDSPNHLSAQHQALRERGYRRINDPRKAVSE